MIRHADFITVNNVLLRGERLDGVPEVGEGTGLKDRPPHREEPRLDVRTRSLAPASDALLREAHAPEIAAGDPPVGKHRFQIEQWAIDAVIDADEFIKFAHRSERLNARSPATEVIADVLPRNERVNDWLKGGGEDGDAGRDNDKSACDRPVAQQGSDDVIVEQAVDVIVDEHKRPVHGVLKRGRLVSVAAAGKTRITSDKKEPEIMTETAVVNNRKSG